jgi:AcrR family transcriptional regulator
MSQSSQNEVEAKKPRRERGRARVQALLAAAGEAFADKGYEATTMTEIAARAGASIGSLYQFFPTKPAIAQTLMQQQIEALGQQLDELRANAAAMPSDALSAALLQSLVQFRATHPSFARLLDTPGAPESFVAEVRKDLRARIGSILEVLQPQLRKPERDAAAWVVQQLMKAAVALKADALSPAQRGRAMDELVAMLHGYLSALARRAAAGATPG